jgi:hypothetical protein
MGWNKFVLKKLFYPNIVDWTLFYLYGAKRINNIRKNILKQLQKLVLGNTKAFGIRGHLKSANYGALTQPKIQFLKLFEYKIVNLTRRLDL